MKQIYNCTLLMLFFIANVPLLAQSTVSGKITDDQGETLPGVTVLEVGTQNGAISDIDGNYQLEVGSNAKLRYSFVGFKAQEVEIGIRALINIILQVDDKMLDEVVVVGYGTQKRSSIAGSVASVDVKKANAVPTTNIAEMLRGKVAGVQVTLGDARPGGNSSILIRGKKSLSASSAPLFIVDGVPVENGINDINAGDVASIEVLKDAASQAIYGARASNGVILITTKRGNAGQMRINYNGFYGTQQLTKNFDLYTAEEWMDLRREAFRTSSGDGMTYFDDNAIFSITELEAADKKSFIDWEDLVLRNAEIQKHDISVSGGDENTKTFASLSIYDQKGILPGSGFTRGTLRFNLDQNLSDKVTIGISSYFSRSAQDLETGGINKFITFSPLAFPFDSLGELNQFPAGGDSKYNPLWNIRESTNELFSVKNNINVFIDFKLFKGFKYRISATSISSNQTGGKYLTALHSSSPNVGSATIYNRSTREYLVENIFDYNVDINTDHHIDATFVQSVNERENTHFDDRASEFAIDDLGYFGIESGLVQDPSFTTANGVPLNWRKGLNSFLGRIRYNYKDKYSFSFTTRADASSVFGEGHKWGVFPAVAVAWNMHEEKFLSTKSIDNLKLRVSYGSIGNEAIPPSLTLPLADFKGYVYDGVAAAGYVPRALLENPSLKWEQSTTLNVGVDFSILNHLLTGSIEYYNIKTVDQLVKRPLPAGLVSWVNIAEVNNKGLEAALTANIISNEHMDWYATVNLTRNRNKIIHLFGELDSLGNELDVIASGWFIGEPINNRRIYVFDGIFQDKFVIEESAQPDAEPGDIRVVDTDGDGKITQNDKQIIGEDPSWYGSFSTNFNYKGFELYAELYMVRGSKKYNGYLADFNSGGSLQGSLNGVKVNYWTPENPSTDFPRPDVTRPDRFLFDRALVDNSYTRLRTLTLGYNLPSTIIDKLSLSNVKFYVTGTNLWTKTDFLSYSPENNPGQFPEAKAYTFGLNVSF